jgi:hypothetical protein
MSSCKKTVSGSLHAELVTVCPNGVASATLRSLLAQAGSTVTRHGISEFDAAILGRDRTHSFVKFSPKHGRNGDDDRTASKRQKKRIRHE